MSGASEVKQIAVVLICILICLNLKINHGLILALIAGSMYLLRSRYVAAILVTVTPLITQAFLTWSLLGASTLIDNLSFHYKFSTNDGFLFSLYHLFALNYKHGYIRSWMILLWLAPLYQLVSRFVKIPSLALYFNKQKKQESSLNAISALTVFSFFSWLMVFPTGSYHHVYYGGFFSLYFLCICIKKILGKYFHFFQVVAYLVVIIQYLPQNYKKYKFYEGFVPFSVAGEKIFVDPFSVDVFTKFNSLDRLYQNQSCRVLNLTPNAIFLPNSNVFCSVDSANRNFTWRSDKKSNFQQFSNRLKEVDFIISPIRLDAPNFVLTQRSSVVNQEYGANYYFYSAQNGDTTSLIKNNAPDKLIAHEECSYLSKIIQHDGSLPVIIKKEEKLCALYANQSVSDQSEFAVVKLYYRLYYSKEVI
jgi:hypothetical protein